ncbi:2-phospho-L-lactate transferase CofD family protein, partial [Streptomyces olivaceus]|uniref:2-phospho-L-lactate transferase CofD family protein n=1 Tax=Streptomyces olivaceus TaxID=47716 RepID=UPI00365B3B41
MTGRTPRLSRLRRGAPEGRGGRPAETRAARPEQARGGRPRRRGTQPKVVALGGGMGLSASLAALRRITGDLTAGVTVADDGGSRGRRRDELGVQPPRALRQALAPR